MRRSATTRPDNTGGMRRSATTPLPPNISDITASDVSEISAVCCPEHGDGDGGGGMDGMMCMHDDNDQTTQVACGGVRRQDQTAQAACGGVRRREDNTGGMRRSATTTRQHRWHAECDDGEHWVVEVSVGIAKLHRSLCSLFHIITQLGILLLHRACRFDVQTTCDMPKKS